MNGWVGLFWWKGTAVEVLVIGMLFIVSAASKAPVQWPSPLKADGREHSELGAPGLRSSGLLSSALQAALILAQLLPGGQLFSAICSILLGVCYGKGFRTQKEKKKNISGRIFFSKFVLFGVLSSNLWKKVFTSSMFVYTMVCRKI